MRTTLTLDDDVVALLEQVRAQRKMSLKELVNDALRAGLADLCRPRRTPPFRTEVVSLGRCRFDDVDDVAGVLAMAEDARLA
jgi:hypothetical protein